MSFDTRNVDWSRPDAGLLMSLGGNSKPDINTGSGLPPIGSKMQGEYVGSGLNADPVYDQVTKTLDTYGLTPEQQAKLTLENNQKVLSQQQQFDRENTAFNVPVVNAMANASSQRKILEMQPALSADLAKAQLGNIQAASGQAVQSLNQSMQNLAALAR